MKEEKIKLKLRSQVERAQVQLGRLLSKESGSYIIEKSPENIIKLPELKPKL